MLSASLQRPVPSTSGRAAAPVPSVRAVPIRQLSLPKPRRCLKVAATEGAGLDPNFAYAVVGLGGLSFLTTFFVLPKLYSKNDSWDKDMLPALRATGVRTVTPAEASSRASRGRAVILDVRLPDNYNQQAARPSVSAPLYIPIQEWDLPSIIRRLGFAFFGVYGTELNPAFVKQARAAVPKGKEVLVICESGGSIDAVPGNSQGKQSRSLKAIYYLQRAGITNVAHISGGLSQWVRDGLPVKEAGDDEDEDGDEGQSAEGSKGLSLVGSLLGGRQRGG